MLVHEADDPVMGRYGEIRASAAVGMKVGLDPGEMVPAAIRSSLMPPPTLLNHPLHRLLPCIVSDEIFRP